MTITFVGSVTAIITAAMAFVTVNNTVILTIITIASTFTIATAVAAALTIITAVAAVVTIA